MSKMIERVAAEIYLAPHTGDIYATPWKGLREKDKDTFRLLARSAIASMREPTKEMRSAEGVHDNCHMCGGHIEGWQHLIDEILK